MYIQKLIRHILNVIIEAVNYEAVRLNYGMKAKIKKHRNVLGV